MTGRLEDGRRRLPSLLSVEDRQLALSIDSSADDFDDLFPPADPPAALSGESTGARFFRARPRDYRRAVTLLAEGMGPTKVARLLGVGVGTVQAIEERELPDAERVRERLAVRMRQVAAAAVEVAAEALEDPDRRAKVSAKDAAITSGILTDKAELLEGRATSRVEHEIAAPAHDDFLREAAAMGLGAVAGAQMERARADRERQAAGAGAGSAGLGGGGPVIEGAGLVVEDEPTGSPKGGPSDE